MVDSVLLFYALCLPQSSNISQSSYHISGRVICPRNCSDQLVPLFEIFPWLPVAFRKVHLPTSTDKTLWSFPGSLIFHYGFPTARVSFTPPHSLTQSRKNKIGKKRNNLYANFMATVPTCYTLLNSSKPLAKPLLDEPMMNSLTL